MAIIKYNNTILKIFSPFMKIAGITLFPYIILNKQYQSKFYTPNIRKKTLINHELIHIEQQKELLVIPFFIIYLFEWFIKLFIYGKDAYRNISFEREAYEHENNFNYLENRKRYCYIKKIFKK